MEVVALHRYPEYLQATCDLINSEWKRSITARQRSLEASGDALPTSLILIENNKVIGHVKLSKIPTMPYACFIESVVIAHGRRGQGLGKYLMLKAEEYCRALGLSWVYLSTMGQEGFYAKLGYAPCQPISIYGTPTNNVQSNNTTSTHLATNTFSGPPPPPLPQSKMIKITQKIYMNKQL